MLRIIRSFIVYVCQKSDIGLQFFGIADSFPGLSLTILLDCLHILVILFPVKHTIPGTFDFSAIHTYTQTIKYISIYICKRYQI